MAAILTRCGYRCDLCLAYKRNIENYPADRAILSDGWFKYYGFRIPPEEICCDGCMSENPCLIDKNCQVRACVIEKGLSSCAYCDDFVCEKLNEKIVDYDTVKQLHPEGIPEEDHLFFILPYENKPRLDELHDQKDK